MEQLFTNCSADTTPQEIGQSLSITRIIYVLSYYSKWVTEQTDKSNLLSYQQLVYMNDDATDTINNKKRNEGIYSWLNSLSATYSLTKLLDDFHYILFFHSSNNDFEMLTDYVRRKLIQNNTNDTNMDLSLSIPLIRNNRSRFRYSQNCNLRVSTYCGYKQNHDVITQQILDSIYCFLLFTFDVGYKLNSKQLAVLDDIDADSDGDDGLFDKRLKYIKDTIYSSRSEEKGEKEEEKDRNVNIFGSGIKFDYWNESNSHYISPKHDTFKEEIVLFNIYCTLNNDQWNDMLIKAQCLLQTNMAKILKASSYFANPFKIEHRSNISLQHIISLLLYTNFRKLRNNLNRTYYATAADEMSLNNVMDRHSEFGHFGRILRESVELFGWQSDDSDAPSIYYVALNKIYLFSSAIPYIYSPLLSSASLNVVLLNNKKGRGQIISLRPYKQYLKYFDCAWIADDIGKDEKLFIGGQEPFTICNIHDIELCVNYKKYITAIDYFNNMIKAQLYLCDDDIDAKIIQIINTLLENKSVDIPSYIVALFECNRRSIDKININRYLMNTTQVEEDTFGYKALAKLFINNDKINSPNLGKYVKIFPNLTRITIQNDEQFVSGGLDIILSRELFVAVFEFYKNVKNKLKIINIQNVNQCQLKTDDCGQIFDQVGNEYDGVNLTIDIQKEINTISIISMPFQ